MENHAPQLKYCLYARKSSESDERQAISIDSQVNEMLAVAERDGIEIVEVLRESHSAKDSGQRPTYNQLLQEIRTGSNFNAILTWAPDRLSRNAGDLGSLVDLMDQGKLIEIRTQGQTFRNSPNEKFLLMILCSQAKLENDNKSLNVLRGMKAKCEMGWRPGVAPLGYMNRAFNGLHDIIPDPERVDGITELFLKAAQGWSGRRIKRWADESALRNRSGEKITLSQVFFILNNTFYYGDFEYPEGTGKWFKGAHKPLISKELFLQIQESRLSLTKVKWGSKTFAFKGIFKCASCGSEITAEEKFKPLKDGSLRRHVYYHCTRQVKYDCIEKYVSETDISAKLLEYIRANATNIQINSELESRAARHFDIVIHHFASHELPTDQLHPLIEYAGFVLSKGSYEEQGELVKGIQSTFVIRDREILVQ